jgi:hypothetical protein
MKRIVTFLIPGVIAAGMSVWSIAPSVASETLVTSSNTPQPGIELVRDRHGGWDNRDDEGGWYRGGDWEGRDWRHRHHRHRHDRSDFSGIRFGFGFGPQFQAPQRDCFQDQWGRVYCNVY